MLLSVVSDQARRVFLWLFIFMFTQECLILKFENTMIPGF